MTREIALQILTKHLSNPILLKHSFAVEAVMKTLALKFNGNVEEWGITGLLHDADYEKCKGNPDKHGLFLFELEPNSIPNVVEHAIKAHNFEFTKVTSESPMDWALYCCDELTGIIMALTEENKEKQLVFPTKDIVLQKLQDKEFAKAAKKEKILLCEAKLGIPLQEFVDITLKSLQGIQEELAP
ncbi:MAG TPA: phosphohydrolase [Candidatus Eisenbacteria bacterium]|nr:phosphohydrolase [Candidatus Eisenbacteria bacterium]